MTLLQAQFQLTMSLLRDELKRTPIDSGIVLVKDMQVELSNVAYELCFHKDTKPLGEDYPDNSEDA